MAKSFFTFTEVKQRFQIEDDFLDLLEEEQIICPQCNGDSEEKHFTPSEVEKLRLAKILMEEMGVNLGRTLRALSRFHEPLMAWEPPFGGKKVQMLLLLAVAGGAGTIAYLAAASGAEIDHLRGKSRLEQQVNESRGDNRRG